MISWLFLPLICATKPTPHASCSFCGSYRPCASGTEACAPARIGCCWSFMGDTVCQGPGRPLNRVLLFCCCLVAAWVTATAAWGEPLLLHSVRTQTRVEIRRNSEYTRRINEIANKT